MNFDPYGSHWREGVPSLTLLETCWQMKSPAWPERFLPYLWAYVARIPLLAALVLTGILLGTVIGQLAG